MIYNDFYSHDGGHSVLWALHENNPFQEALLILGLCLNFSFGDTVTFDDLGLITTLPKDPDQVLMIFP